MNKFILGGVLSAALLAGTAANAATMAFEFDPVLSSIAVTNQGSCLGFGCSVTPALDLPTGTFDLSAGVPQSFDFATFNLNGIGWDSGVKLTATLAFIEPNAGPATSSGKASYGTFLGVLNAGKLTWTTVAPITTSDGSQFEVAFENLKGLGVGTIQDHVLITVDSIAAPAPEPATWATLLLGLFGVGAMLRMRRNAAGVAAA